MRPIDFATTPFLHSTTAMLFLYRCISLFLAAEKYKITHLAITSKRTCATHTFQCLMGSKVAHPKQLIRPEVCQTLHYLQKS